MQVLMAFSLRFSAPARPVYEQPIKKQKIAQP